MSKILKIFPIIIFIAFFSLFPIDIILAADAPPATVQYTPRIGIPGTPETGHIDFSGKTPINFSAYNSTQPIADYIRWIYKFAVAIVGILAAIMLMVGGFVWLTAGGSGEKVSQAQSMIKGSLTGLILTMGAYTLLKTVNPALVDFKIDDITIIKKISELADNRIGAKAEEYKTLSCNTDYSQGVKFYATGYTKPDKKDYSNDDFLCMVAMNCSCPGNKIDKNRNCDHLFPNNKNYHPCEPFTGDDYCNKNSSGKVPQAGDIAVDPACFRENDQFCVQKEGSSDATYTAKDAGGSIKGRRIDIWSENVNAANKNSGVVTVTLGPCK